MQTAIKNSDSRRTRFWYIYFTSLLIAIGLALSTALWARSTARRSHAMDAFIESTSSMTLETMLAHMATESGTTDDSAFKQIESHLDSADATISRALQSDFIRNEKNAHYQMTLARVSRNLDLLRNLSRKKHAENISPSDYEFHRTSKWHAIISDLYSLQIPARALVKEQYWILERAPLVLCIAFLALAVILLTRLDRRRLHDLHITQGVNQQLDSSNQQLRATEQQLRATEQQLLASNQQLRAANQQLAAEEAALRQGEERFRRMFESMQSGVVVYEPTDNGTDFTIKDMNHAAEKMENINRAEAIGRSVLKVFPSVKEFGIFDAFGRVFQTGSPEQFPLAFYRDTRISGWRENYIYRLSSGEIVAIYSDETDRKKAELALRESEKRFRSIVEASPWGMHMYQLTGDSELEFIGANPAADRILSMEHTSLIGKKLLDAFPGLKGSGIPEHYLEVARGGSSWSTEQVEYTDDRISGAFSVVAFQTGPNQMVAGFEDITKRKTAQDDLRRAHDLVSRITDTSPIGIVVVAKKGNFSFVNSAAERILGISRNDLMQLDYNSSTFKTCDNKGNPVPDSELPFQVVMSKQQALYGMRLMITRPDSSRVSLVVNGAPLMSTTGKSEGAVFALEDFTERERIQQELQKGERLESLGILAGGIAHDFNNLLGGLFGFVDLARETSSCSEEVREYLDHAMTAFQRAKSLTQQLLTFSKGGMPCRTHASLDKLVRESTALALSGSAVKCTFAVPDRLWMVHIDEGQISQVINNIVLNARHAMPAGGNIGISFDNIALQENEIAPLAQGNYVRVSIKDCGVGIAPEHLPRIFDPFFTTKHEGSGLGLATSFSIIKKHQGHINAESELGKGTIFTILLPASDGDPEIEINSAPTKRGSGRILIMDDETLLLDMARDALTGFGYSVVTAENGEEAIKRYREAKSCGQPFDLLILDLTIPDGMGGREMMQYIRETDPEIRAIASSGYSEDPVIASPADYGFTACVAKPYRIRELAGVVAQVLTRG